MASLTTTYTGIELKNPLVVAACSLSGNIDSIKAVEEAGAGAMVIKSLFEEQILHERGTLEEALDVGAETFAESITYFPRLSHADAREHVMWVKKARDAVKMPLFASLNAISAGTWVEYAKQLADTGVNGIELNAYAVEADPSRTARDIEGRLMDLVSAVKYACTLPIAVKLSPFYTSVANVVHNLDSAGADAVVLFNRFLQPDIDPDTQQLVNPMTWSTPREMKLPLRWIALLYGRVKLDLIGNTGVEKGTDLARFLLAGATAVQVAGVLCQTGIGHITRMLSDLDAWMAEKGYTELAAFRGRCSQAEFKGDPAIFERAQYVDFLMRQ